MGEVVDAILDHTIKGLDPLGQNRPIRTTIDGRAWVAGGTFETDLISIPGIGTGAAYADGDAFGTMFTLQVPVMFLLQGITFVDLDNEKIAKEVVFYITPFTATADNAAIAPSSTDLSTKLPKTFLVNTTDFVAFNANAVATVSGINYAFSCPNGVLYGQWKTRGADNIAAGAIPLFSISGEVR